MEYELQTQLTQVFFKMLNQCVLGVLFTEFCFFASYFLYFCIFTGVGPFIQKEQNL